MPMGTFTFVAIFLRDPPTKIEEIIVDMVLKQ